MRIKDIRIQIIRRDPPSVQGVGPRYGGVSFLNELYEVPVVTIATDEGIEGNSFGSNGLALAHYLVKLKPLLIGEDPLDREKIWQKLWEQTRILFLPQTALGVIDVALWDIGGKAANLPIYKLLGAYRDKVKAYASSTQRPTTESYVQEALDVKKRGFTAYKLHIPGIPGKDLEICRAVREAVGDSISLMLDPVARYDREQALMVGREIEKLNFYWYEEPISDFDIDGLVELSSALDIPIAGLEVRPGNLYAMKEYLVRGAVDIVRSDVQFNGGITQLKKVASLAEAFGMRCEIHTNFNPLMNAANLHVTCSIKNCEFYEWWIPEELMWDFGVKESLVVDTEGYVHVPYGPGLGLEVDWDYVAAHAIATL
jgi:L-alanine-DL-glutamate epimerase-like enolase superfamily enzyme